ncbi:MAG: hypothetical protein RR780_04795 [Cellulosilyticaceae bacterium]
MACVAEFGIIDNLEEYDEYEYNPSKYHCTAIDDDFITDWWNELVLTKTYFHTLSRPEFGLARWGITLIPTESLETFYELVAKDKRSRTSEELVELMKVVRMAINQKKYVIHYGV